MEIVIDIDESVPAFARAWVGDDITELVDQIKQAVLCGELLAGDALPSIRQLANDLELDDKVVAKAYQLLKLDEVVQEGYLATFVHPDAKSNSAQRAA